MTAGPDLGAWLRSQWEQRLWIRSEMAAEHQGRATTGNNSVIVVVEAAGLPIRHGSSASVSAAASPVVIRYEDAVAEVAELPEQQRSGNRLCELQL